MFRERGENHFTLLKEESLIIVKFHQRTRNLEYIPYAKTSIIKPFIQF
jgi:hypothetical protein